MANGSTPTRAEQIASTCLRQILARLHVGAEIADSEAYLQFQGALEYLLPSVLVEAHPWWRGEGLDGFRFGVARKVGAGEAEFIGHAILIADQTWALAYVRLRVSPEADRFDWI
ncbi:MAG TPA: hypothetical protein VF310_00080, partial [Vicinamibacteria bacterium]